MTDSRAGVHTEAEIAEQPAVFDRLLAARAETAQIAAAIARRRPRFVLLAARGSSDHAALYAKYLTEVLLELPAGLVSPSTTTLYGARPDLSDVLLITVSQSGGSPDLVEVTERARAQGALTVAVTNTMNSDLTGAAELAVDIQAGREVAVAATKTYTATLLSLYLLLDAVRGGSAEHALGLGEVAATALAKAKDPVTEAVQRWRFVDRVVTTGRGFSSATAAEAALKLAETSYLSARSYSGADLLHGPVAAVDEETAVLAIAGEGAGGRATSAVLDVVGSRGADVVAVGSAAHTLTASVQVGVPVTAEEVAPIIEVLPVQQLALGLSVARGFDPDRPRGLNKVTKTR
ncbi:SIS domain-containing protein [Actinoalloteichus hymeniacidonis]|uniref:SIS domain n=1 Tax=Actinoalloteichus hymeniacidonis TaxID=340345 RepID=A0AAC9HL29_9PSEU|nr:SIS domain-containing protein [Actinoalloteichus hymeniacidonis]AOS61268.1 SIS domain [Actinoalloteichus hymeniacidonis]MBB5910729.1 glucosamine--fructose-6-phosphate aminotransferase (isomerizing) [Actinoalloteichus hymeniacidonis]